MSKYYQKKGSISDYLIGILLIFAVGIIPFIVRLSVIPVTEYELGTIRSSEQIADVFSYCKSIVICIVSALLVITIFADTVTDSHEKKFNYKNPLFILTLVYVIFIILSTVFSKYGEIAMNGISERYEGMWVLLGYVTLFSAAIYYVKDDFKLKFVIFGIFLSVALVGFMGFFQFIKKDPFVTDFYNKIILGKYYGNVGDIRIMFENVYSTLYNPNCVGMYTAMMTSFMIVLAVMLPVKSILKYMSLAFSILMFINLIGSESAGGIIAFVCTIIFLCIVAVIYFVYNKKYKDISKSVLFILLTFVVVFGTVIATNKDIKEKISYIADELANSDNQESDYFYKDFSVEGDTAKIVTKDGTITIIYDGTNYKLLGYDGNELVPSEQIDGSQDNSGMFYKYNIKGIMNPQVQIAGNYVVFNGSEITFMFEYADNKLMPISKGREIVDINKEIPAVGFKGKELFATGRGYIWSRSIPMIKNSLIIGTGPDTYTLEFPQNDLLGKTKFLGNPYVIVDKPHNLYLQTAINTGLISFAAMMGIFLLYIFTTLKSILFNEGSKNMLCFKVAFLGAVIGYMVSGLSTDSVVSVAPVFWIILGTGFAVNKL